MAKRDVTPYAKFEDGCDRKHRRESTSSGFSERAGNMHTQGENRHGASHAEIEQRRAYDRRSPGPRHHQRNRNRSRSLSASTPRQRWDHGTSNRHGGRLSPELQHRSSVLREGGRRRHRTRSRSPPITEHGRTQRTHVESHLSRQHRRSSLGSPKRRQRSAGQHSRNPLPSQDESYRGQPSETTGVVGPSVEKEKPNFKPTGLLAAETNKVVLGSGNTTHDIVLKYHEPPEARKPPASEPWVLYVFKGTSPDPLQTIQLYNRSCWLMGRELAVADIPVEHPSCSKQHAVFQFRYIVKKDEWGERKGKVRLYILDLESSNGTLLNGAKIDAARYTECLTGDVVKFGESEREYVLLLPPKS